MTWPLPARLAHGGRADKGPADLRSVSLMRTSRIFRNYLPEIVRDGSVELYEVTGFLKS